MDKPILVLDRVSRLADDSLGLLQITSEVASEEAGLGRGLFIGSCPPRTTMRHVTCAALNSLPGESVIVASSYDLAEAAAALLTEEDAEFWLWPRKGKPAVCQPMASIRIVVPERLYAVESHVTGAGFRPRYVHVVDPHGHLQTAARKPYGSISKRGDNISRFKAVCEATGVVPYMIVWTWEATASMWRSEACRMFGVEAMRYGDGRTLRTAAFRAVQVTVSPEPEQGSVTHWLEPWVHEAFLRSPAVVLVPDTAGWSAPQEIAALAREQGYPVFDVGAHLIGSGIEACNPGTDVRPWRDIREAISVGVRNLNRRVTVITGTRGLWDAGDDYLALTAFVSAARSSTLVVSAPGGPRSEAVQAVVSQINADPMIAMTAIVAQRTVDD